MLGWDTSGEKKLLRVIDFRIYPIVAILSLLNFLGRANFARANAEALVRDLNLTDMESQTCISISIVRYVQIQGPSNIPTGDMGRQLSFFDGLTVIECSMMLIVTHQMTKVFSV